jgi:hypothetical protein
MDEFEYVDTIDNNGETQIKIKRKGDSTQSGALSFLKMFFMEDKQDDPYKPYPVSDGYANITDIMSGRQKVVQDDWMQGCIEIARYGKDFYADKDNKHYYDSESNTNRETIMFKEAYQKDGDEGVLKLRKLWGYKGDETIEERNKRVDKEHREEQLNFFTKFLNKFN